MAALPLLCPAAGPCDLQKCVNPLFEEAEMSRETDQRPAGPQVVQAPGTHDWVRKALLTAVSCPRFSTSSPRMWSRRPRAGFDLPGDVHRDSLRWRWSGRARLAGLCSSSAPGAVRAVAGKPRARRPLGNLAPSVVHSRPELRQCGISSRSNCHYVHYLCRRFYGRFVAAFDVVVQPN